MTLDRSSLLRELDTNQLWDVLVIGGGATGLGAAVEAASRGYRTLLVERDDFAKGTSSRSTKLVHGGVRYLEQFNVRLVTDALRERGHMLRNAPHLVHRMSFVVPIYTYGGLPYYGFGLKLYERLSGQLSLGKSEMLSRQETLDRLPTVSPNGLKGGILYRDGQFDDARYAISLMRTLFDVGGIALNHLGVTRLLQRSGKLVGAVVRDAESGQRCEIQAKVVINATGVFTEKIRTLDDPEAQPLLSISQGSHLVLRSEVLPGNHALMVPKTSDGRVLFAIPWHGHLLVGTTDGAVPSTPTEPRSTKQERHFLTDHIHKYLGKRIGAEDVLSVWSGLRPLPRSGASSTASLSRDHKVLVSPSGLVTITGGKWTTYRCMGEDAINHAASVGNLPKTTCRTLDLHIHGWTDDQGVSQPGEWEDVYGSDRASVNDLCSEKPGLADLLHPRLPYRKGEVLWAARFEMACTVEDVLARRTRALFLDARAAMEAAPVVADLLAEELGWSADLRERNLAAFKEVAEGYIYVE